MMNRGQSRSGSSPAAAAATNPSTCVILARVGSARQNSGNRSVFPAHGGCCDMAVYGRAYLMPCLNSTLFGRVDIECWGARAEGPVMIGLGLV